MERSVKLLVTMLFIVSGIETLYAANITLSPNSGSYKIGQTIYVNVLVTNNQDSINAVSADITYSSDVLEVTSISKNGTIITMWAEEPTYSNIIGKASLEGVILNPGFSGDTGKIVTIVFKTKKVGTGKVVLSSGSVLANDGNATNILGILGSASFNIVENSVVQSSSITTTEIILDKSAPIIKSTSYPESERWYNSREASFEWDVPKSVTAVRALYNEKENVTPNNAYNLLVNNWSFKTDYDGVKYVYVQFKTKNGWGSVSNYKFQIDTEAPKIIKASFLDEVATIGKAPSVFVLAEDRLSGIDHISFSIDGGNFVPHQLSSSNLYSLPKQSFGNHTVMVSVIDKAGNESVVSLKYNTLAQMFTLSRFLLLLFILFLPFIYL